MASFFSARLTSSLPLFLQVAASLVTVTVLLVCTGCHRAVSDPDDPKFIVAEKGDWTITRQQLNDEMNNVLQQNHKTTADIGPAKMPLFETEMLDNMVLKKLILAHAASLPAADVQADEATALQQVKSQFPSDQEFQDKLKATGMTLDDLKAKIHETILIRKTLQKEAFQNIEPTDAEINDFYLKNPDQFQIPAKIRASRVMILVDDKTSPADKIARKKAIDQARARVMKGEDFSKVATEVSQDRYSAPKGGDIGFFQKGENEANFDDVAFQTKLGDVSPVFETPLGYQFIKVTDVHPAGMISIAQARENIANYLVKAKRQEAEQAYAKNLLANSGVTFHLVRVDLPDTAAAPAPGADASAGAAPTAQGTSTPPPSEPAPATSTNAAPQ
jgi:parvulin-like peptidyl-prolyl isomerase